MDTRAFRELVSGQRRGARASLTRGGLWLLEGGYALGSAWRNRRYDRGHLRAKRVNVPVISVGNLTVGGTGKTPMVAWLARWFRGQGARVAVLSRGYGAAAGARNDEALALEELLPDVPHLQDPNRAAAARIAIEELGSQVLVLDDAFQHRRLARDLDLVLIDALAPFGYGHLLPRGLLRESLYSLRRADALVITRSAALDAEQRSALTATLRRYAPTQPILWSEHRPVRLRNSSTRLVALDHLQGQRVAAFCGLGNPAGFRATLRQLQVALCGWREFPDHYAYQRSDVDGLAHWAQSQEADLVLCTHKDLVKLRVDALDRTPLWALDVEMHFPAGCASLEAMLQPLAAQARRVADLDDDALSEHQEMSDGR